MSGLRWLALAASLGLPAQEPTIKTTVRLVVAPTTVTDRAGRYVDGLGEGDFVLFDGGTPRPVKVDYTYVPISLVIAIQTSSLSEEPVNKVRKAGSLIEPLVVGEPGEVALVTFDEEVRVVRPFTSDFADLTGALKKLDTGGEDSRLIDGVIESVKLLATRPPTRRRVMLLISEARDRSSRAKLEDAVTYAQRENVSIYCATYSAHLAPYTAKPGTLAQAGGFNLLSIFREIGQLAKTNAADALARYTGGSRLSFLKQRALERVVSKIGEELHSQYLLSFSAPEDASPEFHPIEVKVARRPDAVARTRPGYWMSAP